MNHQHSVIDHPVTGTVVSTTVGSSTLLVSSALVALFAALTFVGANIVIPLEPVPVTMQTLFVLLAGAMIGRGRGALSQALYVGAGALGLPIYAGGLSGWGIIAGPTGGYLAAFIVTPIVVAALIGRSQRLAWQAAVFTLGTVIIFVLGVSHLALFYTHDFLLAVRVGFLPFVPGAVFKIVAALSIYRSYTALRGRGLRSRVS